MSHSKLVDLITIRLPFMKTKKCAILTNDEIVSHELIGSVSNDISGSAWASRVRFPVLNGFKANFARSRPPHFLLTWGHNLSSTGTKNHEKL